MAQKEAIMRALMEAMGAGKAIPDADRRRLSMIMGESGKGMSNDADRRRQRAMDRAGMLEALEAGETGMGVSDADMARLRRTLGMMGGGAVKKYKKGGAVKKKKSSGKKSRNGCVMAGRGGKYKGMK
jgi:hypothetical protein